MKHLTILLACSVLFSVALAQPIPIAVAPPVSTTRVPGLFPSPEGGGTLYHCLFDRTFDLTGDKWPDGWTRKSGIDGEIGYPSYVPMEVAAVESPASSFAFRISVSGGGAAAFSPRIPLRPGLEYHTSVLVRTQGVTRDAVFFVLALFGNETTTPLATHVSPVVRDSPQWIAVTIPPVIIDNPKIRYATIGLCVVPDPRQDYSGQVEFTDVRLDERPRVTLTTSASGINPSHIFFSPRNIDVQCRIDGVPTTQKEVTLTLEDHFGRAITSRTLPLTLTPILDDEPASEAERGAPPAVRSVFGIATWGMLPITVSGFYQVRVSTDNYNTNTTTPMTLVVMDATPSPVGGIFGWSLPAKTLQEISAMKTLLGQAGVSRLKMPLWLPATATGGDWGTLREVSDWLSRRRIQLVGLLAPPPSEIIAAMPLSGNSAAAVFTQPQSAWFPTLQKMLLQMSLLVKHWQLSSDDDCSLYDIPQLETVLAEIRRLFNTIGYDVSLGAAWDWSVTIPTTLQTTPQTASQDLSPDTLSPDAVREFVQLTSTVPLAPSELQYWLDQTSDTAMLRWVSLEPLSSRDYSTVERVNDLVQSMVAAKVHLADAAFVPRPFDDERGLMRQDLSPSVLFLPWRTTALTLNETRPIGSIRLPNRSPNLLFERPDRSCLMMVWNAESQVDSPVNEVLYLGNDVEIAELWGKHQPPQRDGAAHVIPVPPVPVFVTGLHRQVAEWRQTFRFDNTDIPTFIGQRNNNAFHFTNNTQEGVGVRVDLVIDPASGITLNPASHSFVLEPGAEAKRDFVVTISPKTPSGRHPIRADVVVEGLETLRFAVYDDFQLGGSDLSLSFLTRINRQGELEVTQSFTNDGDAEVSYRFVLYAPGRSVQRTRVLAQGPGRNEQTYTLPRGNELLGQEIIIRGEAIPPSTGQPIISIIRAVAY